MFNAFNMCTKDFSLIAENRVFGNSFHERRYTLFSMDFKIKMSKCYLR